MKMFRKTIKFYRLQDMDKWLESWKRKVLEFLGLFEYSIFSHIMLSCQLFPSAIDLDYIDKNHSRTLQMLARELLENKSRRVRVREGVNGRLIALEITQEDFYWQVYDAVGKQNHYISCCSYLDFLDCR